nr:ComEA family DNA-binding protein [Synergistaceae bacterium]
VYVTGSVKQPGVYEVPPDSRVHYAVERAGGFSAMADPEGVNLAEKLSDGAHIRVPAKGEAHASGAGNAAASSTGRVDINSASVTELQTLPGVGPKTAEAIIANREAMGRFVQVDDLMRVKGIGPKRMEQLRELVTTGR